MVKNKKLTNKNTPKGIETFTTKNDGIFRVAFSGEVEHGYDFVDINEKTWYKLGEWLDGNVGKKIGEIATTRYGRSTDRKDKKRDPYSAKEKNQQHYCFFGKRRIHGYYNKSGYFTITRIDPEHKFHKK